ncbi:hypothetical protein AGDE_17107 [Angomonas deanei]|uniref:Uncharacterized protein n=1 Tax=Angomonas deanei TaxID=59799 RepID=A0A7G2C881_9TRYP|nr:hypothetical protein AGDE_17107 [Angomonas deanei]CAD2214202.1 hypothetical protein, conserved [Angomonas deanei]|eukprot:EPY15460.1 hypothetical protein AGDE_17107 [Angomonas deanei]
MPINQIIFNQQKIQDHQFDILEVDTSSQNPFAALMFLNDLDRTEIQIQTIIIYVYNSPLVDILLSIAEKIAESRNMRIHKLFNNCTEGMTKFTQKNSRYPCSVVVLGETEISTLCSEKQQGKTKEAYISEFYKGTDAHDKNIPHDIPKQGFRKIYLLLLLPLSISLYLLRNVLKSWTRRRR